MPLLADYAITPDVFDVTSYSSEEVCGLYLGVIREAMLDDGLVRDLRDGSGADRSRGKLGLGIVEPRNSPGSWPRRDA